MHTQLPPKGQGISGSGLRVASFGLWVLMRGSGFGLRVACCGFRALTSQGFHFLDDVRMTYAIKSLIVLALTPSWHLVLSWQMSLGTGIGILT
jgi:hypothetical protein